MRNRQRTSWHDVPVQLLSKRSTPPWLTPAEPAYQTVPVQLPLPSKSQRMIDEDRFENWYNDCFNQVSEWKLFGYAPDFGQAGLERNNLYITYLSDGVPRLCEIPVLSLVPYVLASFPELLEPYPWRRLASAYRYDSWAHAPWREPIVAIDSGFSLANFVLEWRETLELVKSWTSRKRLLARWHALMGRNRTLPQRLRAAANERLAHVYGTKLFLADARTIWEILRKWRLNFDRILSESGTIKRTYRRPYTNSFSKSPWRASAMPVFDAIDSQIFVNIDVEVKFSAALYYTYTVRDIKGYLARASQICDAFGLHLDAGIVWDAVPYTFVVDWFINISEWLHSNASYGRWNKVDIRILQAGHSFRAKITESVSWSRTTVVSTTAETHVTEFMRREQTIYRRVRDKLPPIEKKVFAFNKEPWSIDRIINATALVVQKCKMPGRLSKRRPIYGGKTK